ncbi:hypothetical protein [Pelomicrobium sp. G1]|uniref:hypothetical protein n=1 Tax=Pelomicrobium sp. G1 TaxID=3452920 RepID=UPI003F76CBF2
MLQDEFVAEAASTLDWSGILGNLVPVTLGNVAGGSMMVALVYSLIYRRPYCPSAPRD